MSRIRVMINNANAKEIYQYFAKALHEKRIFEDDPKKLTEAQQSFLQITPTHDADINSPVLKASLQEWIDAYVSQSKWQRCLATLRQIRSNHRNEVKSVKLSKETYALLKSYADCLQLSIPQAIHVAVEPLLQDLQVMQLPEETSTALDPELSNQHEIKVKLWLNVENISLQTTRAPIRSAIRRHGIDATFVLSQLHYTGICWLFV